MNEVCDAGSGAPNIDFVVSVAKSIYSFLSIFSKICGVIGGSGVWVTTTVGGTVRLVP